MELADALSLLRTAQQVSVARDREDITGIVKRAARQLSGAEGVTFVLRDGDYCYYVDEDAISPLWKGSRFPMEICISGWAMMHRQTVVIEDIYSDDRIPHEAYRPTFVQSLAMIPVRSADPIAAIGVYWATRHAATPEEIEVLQWLADITAVAIDNLQLINALESRAIENERNLKQLEAEVAKRETAESQFLQAQKMEAIGQLAGTIAHDFNNLLSVISASADLALDEMGEGERPDEHLETILGATESAASLTRQLLSFSRRQPVKEQAIDLADAVGKVRPMLERLLGSEVALETDIPTSLGPVKFDPSHLEQVIMNLAVNARDAMPAGGTVRFEAWRGSPEDEHVVLNVSDTGDGMDEDTLGHLFEPFFTTKPSGKGTGLGLSAVHNLVSRSGGRVDVDSQPGRGATFKLSLVAANTSEDATATSKRPSTERTHRTGTILVVETDDALCRLLVRTLTKDGYDVLTVRSAEEATAIFRQPDYDIRLVLTDLSLPTTSGGDLAKSLLSRQADLSVIFISGPTHDVAIDFSLPNIDYLQKPVSPQELLEKVHEVLSRVT